MSTSAPLTPRSMGQSMTRVDGRLKVTGAATYSAEFAPQGVAHARLVMSSIANGTIKSIDTSAAEKAPGVLAVITHQNALKLAEPPNAQKSEGIRIEQRIPFSDAKISYGGQYVAMVVADTSEQARHAASLINVAYAAEKPALTREDAAPSAKKPKQNMGEDIQVKKGDFASIRATDLVTIEQFYSTPSETHSPMECSATVAVWDGPEKLTLYDATQYVKGVQGIIAHAFKLKRENVHIVCPYVGGAFGCKGPVWPHTFLAAMAAKMVNRPVSLELTRQEMFSGTGHRTPTFQTIALSADKGGKLQSIRHQSEFFTSPVGSWVEPCGIGSSNVLYDAPHIEFGHTAYTVNLPQPSFMRAPGECPGTYAMECAMDELAYALKMDPLQLRLVNDSPNHPVKGVPWSTKHLSECYRLGAEKFGWAQRLPEPRSMKDGDHLVGWGLATATYPANQWAANAHIALAADGSAHVRCAAHDLGTGAYTAFTQISADAIGLPADKITVELGDSDLPFGPVAGGSNSTATVGSVITITARLLHEKLAKLAIADSHSPLYQAKTADLAMLSPGHLSSISNPSKSDSFTDILSRAGLSKMEADGSLGESKDSKHGFQSFGAQFCEVKIDPDLPLVRVTRFVSVMDCGRVINPKTGGNQIVGGIVMGIGMALEEDTVHDPKLGLAVTRNFADYHVPVNADVGSIDVHFVGEPDFLFNPMGSRGMGEIGITGTAAAIANAVYHATGRRVRELPITLDKLI